jgi:hypothetical protein
MGCPSRQHGEGSRRATRRTRCVLAPMTHREPIPRRTFLIDAVRLAAAGWLTLDLQLLVGCARDESNREGGFTSDVDRAADEAMVGWNMPSDGSIRWEVGRLALSLWRANRLPESRASLPHAVELQLAGDWRAAANEWERLGSPASTPSRSRICRRH